jgi:hypothetical protein
MAYEGGGVASDVMGGGDRKSEKAQRLPQMRLWVARVSTVLLWTCVVARHFAGVRMKNDDPPHILPTSAFF